MRKGRLDLEEINEKLTAAYLEKENAFWDFQNCKSKELKHIYANKYNIYAYWHRLKQECDRNVNR